ncbi:hypothetical protein TNCV_2280291 [Trichonephila clavipes]|nr:hypothetical protein TNCV_2280291 [Trichonephila clavipes]
MRIDEGRVVDPPLDFKRIILSGDRDRIRDESGFPWIWPYLLKNNTKVLQKKQKQNSSQNVVDVPLCCKCASNNNQRGLAVKRNGTLDHNSWLRREIVKAGSARCPGRLRHVFDDRQNTVGGEIRRSALYVPSQHDFNLI